MKDTEKENIKIVFEELSQDVFTILLPYCCGIHNAVKGSIERLDQSHLYPELEVLDMSRPGIEPGPPA
jgi:hypothetical protein